MQPMPARQRRIVHMTLRKDQRVRTKSYGSGRGRAVTVFPVDK
jgi:predicted RNA-binding protein Jag